MDGIVPEASNEQLRQELAELKGRVEALEHALRPSSDPFLPVASPRIPRENAVASPTLPPIAQPSVVRSATGGDPSGLENRIGAQVFNRVGVFAVLAGAAWFLKLAVDRAWIGPGIRIAIGLLVAAGLVAWSERFRRNSALTFSYTLKALGAGIAYLSLWASFSVYHLLPPQAVFAAMVAVTVTNALFAWWQNSELLAALALAGGLATPALLSTGGDHEIFLLSYLLLLDTGALVLLALRPWPRLAIAAFTGTTVYFALWWVRYFDAGHSVPTGVFIALFFGLFTAAPFLRIGRNENAVPNDLPLTLLPIAVGGGAYIEAANLMSSRSGPSATYWVAVALGLAYLALTVFARFLTADFENDRSAARLRIVHLGLAVAFLALAAPLKFHGYGIPLVWLVELLILVAASARLEAHQLVRPLRIISAAMLLLSFCALLSLHGYDPPPVGATAFVNPQFATYLAGVAAFALVVLLSRNATHAVPIVAKPASLTLDDPVFLAGFAVIAFNVVALLAVSLQIELYWWQRPELRHLGIHHAIQRYPRPDYVDLSYSAWFMLYGAALMAAGFLRRSAFLRWQALILLTLSIGKVFLFDTGHLSEGYRVASFLGLGVLLLAVSFVYQRDWLGLRERRG